MGHLFDDGDLVTEPLLVLLKAKDGAFIDAGIAAYGRVFYKSILPDFLLGDINKAELRKILKIAFAWVLEDFHDYCYKSLDQLDDTIGTEVGLELIARDRIPDDGEQLASFIVMTSNTGQRYRSERSG